MNLPVFLFLDPLPWLLFISAILGAVLAVYLFMKDGQLRFTIASFFVFNMLVVARYVVLIVFKQDFSDMTKTEISVVNQLSQISQIYISWIIIISEATKISACTKKRLAQDDTWRGGIL
jgi:hypothetical protein